MISMDTILMIISIINTSALNVDIIWRVLYQQLKLSFLLRQRNSISILR